jgi:methyl coenzyme M reductase gamma subunit
MEQWEYDISVHAAGEIVAAAQGAPEGDRVLFCQAEGQCFFDDAPNPYLRAMVTILNARGRDGWVLVQTVLRQQDMICFWRRPVV